MELFMRKFFDALGTAVGASPGKGALAVAASFSKRFVESPLFLITVSVMMAIFLIVGILLVISQKKLVRKVTKLEKKLENLQKEKRAETYREDSFEDLDQTEPDDENHDRNYRNAPGDPAGRTNRTDGPAKDWLSKDRTARDRTAKDGTARDWNSSAAGQGKSNSRQAETAGSGTPYYDTEEEDNSMPENSIFFLADPEGQGRLIGQVAVNEAIHYNPGSQVKFDRTEDTSAMLQLYTDQTIHPDPRSMMGFNYASFYNRYDFLSVYDFQSEDGETVPMKKKVHILSLRRPAKVIYVHNEILLREKGTLIVEEK